MVRILDFFAASGHIYGMNKDFVFPTRESGQIQVSISGVELLADFPVVIFVHGFKGFKDWGFGPYLAEYFSENGLPVIRFNFSHNGIGEKADEFTELEKFAKNTFTLEVSELGQIIDAYLSGFFAEKVFGKFFLLGHSRGGGIALLSSRHSPHILGTATWAAISNIDRWSERQKKEWRRLGYIELLNTRTQQKMHLNKELFDDIEKHKDGALNILKAAGELKTPVLLVHGELDMVVPIAEAWSIYGVLNSSIARLEAIPRTGHTFDIVHPFEKCSFSFNIALQKTLDFFTENI